MRRAVNYAVDRRALAANSGTFYEHTTPAQMELPVGLARAFAYARIDDILVRDDPPAIPYANEDAHDFFSSRVGCQLYQPLAGMDLGALCIRSGRTATGRPQDDP